LALVEALVGQCTCAKKEIRVRLRGSGIERVKGKFAQPVRIGHVSEGEMHELFLFTKKKSHSSMPIKQRRKYVGGESSRTGR
jgi:hypothetical protein